MGAEPALVSHRAAWKSALLIVLLASLTGLATNFGASRPISLLQPLAKLQPGDVSIGVAHGMLNTPGVLFLDARSSSRFRAKHLPGALHLSPGLFQSGYPKLATQLESQNAIVVYCSGRRCPKAEHLRKLLESKGHKNVLVMRDGISGWAKRGLPLESDE